MPTLSKVEMLPAEQFIRWWAKSWKKGEHVAVLGMTGAGKTTLVAFLCTVRKYVLALDAKGLDGSLSATGWPRYGRWPLPMDERQRIKEGQEPVRAIIGGKVNNDPEFAKNAALLRRVIAAVWGQGKWTLWADEGQILADKRYVGAGDTLERMLIAARDRLISLIYCVQRPQIGRSSPAAMAAFANATWLFVSHTRDQRVHDRLAEVAGRPVQEMRGLIEALPKYYWACFSLDPHEPVRIVLPPELPPVTQARKESSFTRFMWK